MQARQHTWPRLWLMTDERMGDRLWIAIDQLPDGDSGIVFRHYATEPAGRLILAKRIADVCHRRRITLAMARHEELAVALGADLVHNPATAPTTLPFSKSVHSIEEAIAARDAGVSLIFVSPVHPTRSHPGRPGLGRPLAVRIAKAVGVPAIALGGMNARNFPRFHRDGFYGWAGIDAWMGDSDQNLKAVPT